MPPPPPPEMGVKMYELGQTNLFTPERKKGGTTHWRFVANCWQGLGLGGMEYVEKAWTWTPTWSALMDMGGINPAAANQGGVCRIGARHRLPAQVQAQARRNPRFGPPRSRTLPTPGTLATRPWGPSPPPWTAKARYVECILALI